MKPRDAERSKNFFALGLISWMYTRPIEPDHRVDRRSSSRKHAMVRDANLAAFKAGLHFGETAELFEPPVRGPARRKLPPGRYRNITGNVAVAYGLIAARAAGEAADPLRVVPDHAGVRHPPRALEAQELRRAHAAGRGRDRRRRRSRSAPRSPASSASPPRAVPASTSRPRRSASRSASSCRWCSSTCSAAARPPACPPRPSRPTCCSRCTAATASRRCRSSPRSRRATASTPRSRRCASR